MTRSTPKFFDDDDAEQLRVAINSGCDFGTAWFPVSEHQLNFRVHRQEGQLYISFADKDFQAVHDNVPSEGTLEAIKETLIVPTYLSGQANANDDLKH